MNKIDISTIDDYRALPEKVYFAFKEGEDGLPYFKNVVNGRVYSVRNTRSAYPTLDVPKIKKTVSCHRFFAKCFLKNPDPKTCTVIDHKDKDKYNFKIDNLEWVTPSENERRKK